MLYSSKRVFAFCPSCLLFVCVAAFVPNSSLSQGQWACMWLALASCYSTAATGADHHGVTFNLDDVLFFLWWNVDQAFLAERLEERRIGVCGPWFRWSLCPVASLGWIWIQTVLCWMSTDGDIQWRFHTGFPKFSYVCNETTYNEENLSKQCNFT